jgi:tetraacyldisaccharide 4'-kinase
VIADADRVGAANWARERFGITAFVLDDGFQHRRAARDLDIVCVDATNPWGGGRVLPAGNLRESLTGIRRADLIVLTRANLVDSTAHIIHRLRRLGSTAPVFLASTKTTSLTALNDFLAGVPTSAAAPVSALAFAAIGNPDSLRSQLLNENFAVAGFETFRDHHHYTQQDVNAVEARARELAAASLLTTAKDAVKLAGLRFSLPVVVVGSDTELDDLKAFRSLVIGDQRASKVR